MNKKTIEVDGNLSIELKMSAKQAVVAMAALKAYKDTYASIVGLTDGEWNPSNQKLLDCIDSVGQLMSDKLEALA